MYGVGGGVISAVTGKPKISRKFGNKATMSRWKDALLGEGVVNPIYVSKIFDEVWGRTMTTLDRWSEVPVSGAQPYKLYEPFFIIRNDDQAIYVDLVGEVVPSNDALDWYSNRFNIPLYKDALHKGIEAACRQWARKRWDKQFIVTEQGIQESKAE